MHVHNTNLLLQLVIRVNSQTSQKTLDRQNYFFNQRRALLLIEYPSISSRNYLSDQVFT